VGDLFHTILVVSTIGYHFKGMTIVDQFNDDPEVFVFPISIMVGGVGLNLVAANKVVIFDPNWSTSFFNIKQCFSL
jgi:hypothetical protein